MGEQLNLRNTAVLETLRNAFLRFKSEVQDTLHLVNNEIARFQNWIEGRRRYWQSELARRQEILYRAERALRACERDCGGLYEAVRRAKQAVKEAEHELSVVQMHMRRVEEATNTYKKQAIKLQHMLDSELMKGASLLHNISNIAGDYASGSSGVNVEASRGEAIGVSSVHNYDTGAFVVSNWAGYPSTATKPVGPFRLLPLTLYIEAQKQRQKANRAFHKAHPELKGKDIHHIQPIKFGGHPTALNNLEPLSEEDHAAITTWWNRVRRKMEKVENSYE